MSDRKDVDRKRIAVVGHSEGGSVGMIAAAKDNRIAALVLVATIGVTGAELNMAQVNHALSTVDTDGRRRSSRRLICRNAFRLRCSPAKAGRRFRRPAAQADIPWFQSFLSYDPPGRCQTSDSRF